MTNGASGPTMVRSIFSSCSEAKQRRNIGDADGDVLQRRLQGGTGVARRDIDGINQRRLEPLSRPARARARRYRLLILSSAAPGINGGSGACR
ncbi:hypothetical protein LNP74_14500 [Klebsiella pneumoniae subsp. pneumoniae]|nr:hypothetical protein [Klebsiella pneumoniae subsp. pneumoniae]